MYNKTSDLNLHYRPLKGDYNYSIVILTPSSLFMQCWNGYQILTPYRQYNGVKGAATALTTGLYIHVWRIDRGKTTERQYTNASTCLKPDASTLGMRFGALTEWLCEDSFTCSLRISSSVLSSLTDSWKPDSVLSWYCSALFTCHTHEHTASVCVCGIINCALTVIDEFHISTSSWRGRGRIYTFMWVVQLPMGLFHLSIGWTTTPCGLLMHTSDCVHSHRGRHYNPQHSVRHQ